MKNYVIILAAGDGKRIGSKTPKCFIKFHHKEIYKYSLETFLSMFRIKKVVLVVPKGYVDKVDIKHRKLIVVEGGSNRNESFELGLKPLLVKGKPLDKVLVHDAARPYVTQADIQLLLKSYLDYGTLAYVGKANNVDYRISKYNILTPQFFRLGLYANLESKDVNGKDMISYFKLQPTNDNFIICNNKDTNFKITFKKDLER